MEYAQASEPPPASGRAIAAVTAAIVALWLLTLALVSPIGEFPLNDDWIYARAVQDWIEEGSYSGHPFAAANLFGQAAWGRLFCVPFGFSFTALRCSTLVLWLGMALAVGLGALALRARPWTAALAGGVVLANPLTMNLGYTFMTDVPFMAAMAFSGYCYLRALAEPRSGWLLAGSLFGAWGLLIRQFAVLVPLAAALALVPLAFRLGRQQVLRLAPAFVLPWVAAWLALQFLPSNAEHLGIEWNPNALGNTMLGRVFGGFKFYGLAMTYLALFCLPLVLAASWDWLRNRLGSWQRRLAGAAFLFVLLALIVCWSEPHRIPFLGNLLYDTGIGPMTIKGIFMGSFLWRPVAFGGWWWIPTLLGLLGAAWMFAGSVRWFVLIPGDGRRPAIDARRRQQAFLMLWAVFMIGAIYHPWIPVRFDRYLLGAFVPVVLLVAMVSTRKNRVVSVFQVATFLGLYAFSVFGLQDYMAWNTARWDAVNRLMAEGVPPEEIDAGYEFNGWHTSPHFIEREGPRAFLHSGELGWWAVGDTYAISWLNRPGFDKVEEIPYDSWLAGEAGRLWLLRKKESE